MPQKSKTKQGAKFAKRMSKIKDKRGAPKSPKRIAQSKIDEPKSAAYVRRYAELRTRRLEKRVGKAMIFDEEKMVKILIAREVPTMVKHCIIKVFKKVDGAEKVKFLSAFNICTAVFQKYGYLKVTKDTMKPTGGKGKKRNARHQEEKEAGKKDSAYARLERMWDDDMKAYKSEKPNKGKKK